MAVVSFISDLGTTDYYLAAVRAQFLAFKSSCDFVEISNNIENFNVRQAAFILKRVFKDFPQGSIHIFGVNAPSLELDLKYVVGVFKGHYFIGADNGFMSLISQDEPIELYEINLDNPKQYAFPTRDLYPNIIQKIIQNVPLDQFTKVYQTKVHSLFLKPQFKANEILGAVLYVDSYGNLHTNISRSLFNEIQQDRNFEILLRGYQKITKIVQHYSDVKAGLLVAFFNSYNVLEIAVNLGEANKLFATKVDDPIKVYFTDNPFQS